MTLSRDDMLQAYWFAHPRFQFFKAVPQGARFLDIGAGSGGMIYWQDWLTPIRTDVRMFAIDLSKGELFDRYEDFQVGNVEEHGIGFGNERFEAALGSHVLEHLSEPQKFLKMLFDKMMPGGRVYLEVPTPQSKILPTKEEMAVRNIPVAISNFFDDNTHIDTFDLQTLAGWGKEAGFAVDAEGLVRQPYLEERLLQYGVEHEDAELLLYGYWSITGWAHYIILRRPFAAEDFPESTKRLVSDEWVKGQT